VNRTRLFVYGTLKRGFPGAHLLRDALFEGAAVTAEGFALYDLGAYPALVRTSSGVVRGESFSLPREMLAVLDEYEGVPHLYQRQLLTLSDGREAEAYVMQAIGAVGHPRIEAGVWLGPRAGGRDANF
jgi:gamma-glutamylaminecyclotransferase